MFNSGKTKIAIISLSIITILAVFIFAVLVAAGTHVSTAVITPDLVTAGSTTIFKVEISSIGGAGDDPISEVRIYDESLVNSNPNPFTSIDCQSKSGWNGPFVISGSEGTYCLYTASNEANQIEFGESEIFEFESTAPATDSCRTFHFESRDVDQFWQPIFDEVCVDAKAPETTQTFIGPQKLENDVEWIDGVTLVDLTAIDPDPHPSGVDKTYYKNILVEDFAELLGIHLQVGPEEPCRNQNLCTSLLGENYNSKILPDWQLYEGPFTKDGESCHTLFYYSVDELGNAEDVKVNCFFVDTTPPKIEKEVGEPKVKCEGEACDYYVTQETDINLWCTDQEPHPSDDVTIHWQTRVDEGQGWSSWTENSENTNHVTFNFQENSLHELEYWCTDAVDKESDHFFEIDKVDSEPPVITKEMIGVDHLGVCPPQTESDTCYVADNGLNGVNISVVDPNPIHAVDDVQCNYELWWNEQMIDSNEFDNYKEIIFKEDSTHTLKIWCADALGNKVYDEEEFLVDSTPPVTTKELGDPKKIENGVEWINSSTPITLTADDEKVGVANIQWRNLVFPDNDEICSIPENCNIDYYSTKPSNINEAVWQLYDGPFTKPEESCHVLQYFSMDKLGNVEEINSNCFFVDNTPPEGNKDVGQPSVQCDVNDPECDYYVTVNTPITLSCEDINQPHPVEDETVHWRFSFHDGGEWTFSEWFWDESPVDVYFDKDSLHDLEFFCTDALGNANEVDRELFFVDTVPPVINKTIVGPSHGQCPPRPNTEDVCYIDGVTEIHVNATDPEPHPVGDVTCEWDYNVYEGGSFIGSGGSDGPVSVPFVIQFPEESRHELTITCWDGLGNEVNDYETFYVDKTGPEINKEYGEPFFSNDAEWITSETPIYVNLPDAVPHPSGTANAEYSVTLVDDDACRNVELCQNTDGSGDFTQAELIDVMAVDYNGDVMICHNDENMILSPEEAEDHIADHPDDFYGQCGGSDSDRYVDSNNKIAYCHNDHGSSGNFVHKISGIDGADNHVGKSHLHDHLGDHYGPCTEKQFEFSIEQESCYLIEIKALDNVDKTSTHKQCVFVDNTPPTPIKEVGEPKDLWTPGENNDPLSVFFLEANEQCWNNEENELECWQVTLDTPISMTCLDEGPHPVDHERVHFNVNLDGEDATEVYCNEFNGYFNETTGFCVLDGTTDDFTFLESSEHELEFFCEDALGNKGPLDIEKFKVDGEDFEIVINKKWNLISTPFVLLNENISEVFDPIKDDIESVWAYDPLNDTCESVDGWCVFNPNNGPSNLLKTMQPGWGYWVLANNDATLVIGGSLLAPGRTPPERMLIPGWNLIGYYGTEPDNEEEPNVDIFDGPDGDGVDAYCALYSLTSGELGLAKWNSLFGYWEPDEPSFEGYSVFAPLDPGAGYWISMKDNQVQYIYSPSTVCTSFFDGWFF